MSITEQLLIDGEKRAGGDGGYPVTAPVDLSVIAQAPRASLEDVDAAVKAAQRAFTGGWRDTSPSQRQRLLIAWADAVEKRAEAIGSIAGREGGLAGTARIAHLHRYADAIRYNAGLCISADGLHQTAVGHSTNYYVREPIGVAVVMAAWNTVVLGAMQKSAAALAAGNTVVVRAPDAAPLSTLMLAETLDEAGFPPGVVNILSADTPAVSKRLVEHPGVGVVSFTGSVEVGRSIAQAAAPTFKRLVLELGGKSPMIVHDDADLDKASETAATMAFGYQGQVCCAVSRLLVQRSVLTDVLDRIRTRVSAMAAGDPDDGAAIGPLFNEQRLERTQHYVGIGQRDGELIVGGKRIETPPMDRAYYHEPTVFLFDDDRSPLCREEVFGPVLSVIPFDSDEDALRIANGTRYGLASSVWTRDLTRARHFVSRLETGTVWVNAHQQFSPYSPWGGVKLSGIGRECGRPGYEAFTEVKNVWINP